MKLDVFTDDARFEDYLKISSMSLRENIDADIEDVTIPDWFRLELIEAFKYTKTLSNDFHFTRGLWVLYALYDDMGAMAGTVVFAEDRHMSGSIQADYIAIRKDYRGKGLGKVLLDLSEKVIKEHSSADQILLSTVATKSFYEKMGMEIIGEIRNDAAKHVRYFFRRKV